MSVADLHLHTTASDGALTPREVVEQAATQGLQIIAITDHDTMDGVPEALRHAEAHGIQVLPGIELSLDSDGDEIHLLAYGIDLTSPQLLEHLRQFRDDRIDRMQRMVERLNALGYPISVQEVQEVAGDASIGRPHVARALVNRGYMPSVAAAFDRLLATGRPAYVSRRKVGLDEGVALVHAAGGVAVCAHPGLYRAPMQALEQLIAAGLDGIEVIHSAHSEGETARWDAFAREAGLLRTGGSDCHGPGVKREIYMGRFRIPASWVSALEERIELRKEEAR